MIGLGSQYLTAAGFGRYRITAASLGNLDLLGTLSWLKDATKAAILGAFRDDGMAVINATNDYLNGIAASDRDKATALAGFINEDPMMVCSLGLQPQGVDMPIRWLVNNGAAYIDTGFVPTNQTSIDTVYNATSSNCYVYGSAIDYSNRTMEQYGTELHFGVYKGGLSGLYGAVVHLWSNVTQYYWTNNGNNYSTSFGAYSGTFPYTMGLFALHRASWLASSGKIKMNYYKMSIGGSDVRNMVPFESGKQGIGMVDLVGMEFHEKLGSGSFTIEYTLPDGTPWTPSTP